MCRFLLAMVGLVSGSMLSGCGTLMNVTAPVDHPVSGCTAWGPSTCEPFGGAQRSMVLGGVFLMGGPVGILPAAAIYVTEVPLSLVGDVVTLPIVLARKVRQGKEEEPQNRKVEVIEEEWRSHWKNEAVPLVPLPKRTERTEGQSPTPADWGQSLKNNSPRP